MPPLLGCLRHNPQTIEIVSKNMLPAMPLAVSERLHAQLRLLYASRGS